MILERGDRAYEPVHSLESFDNMKEMPDTAALLPFAEWKDGQWREVPLAMDAVACEEHLLLVLMEQPGKHGHTGETVSTYYCCGTLTMARRCQGDLCAELLGKYEGLVCTPPAWTAPCPSTGTPPDLKTLYPHMEQDVRAQYDKHWENMAWNEGAIPPAFHADELTPPETLLVQEIELAPGDKGLFVSLKSIFEGKEKPNTKEQSHNIFTAHWQALYRRENADKVTPFWSHTWLESPDYENVDGFTVLGVADINGDNTSEVIMRQQCYEGHILYLFQYSKGHLKEVLSRYDGC